MHTIIPPFFLYPLRKLAIVQGIAYVPLLEALGIPSQTETPRITETHLNTHIVTGSTLDPLSS